jgi:endonuclease G, mitochondrial
MRMPTRSTPTRALFTLLAVITLVVLLIYFIDSNEWEQASETNRHLALGNPSGALADVNQPANYLIVRDQYALSYHRDRGTPNWVAWHLQASDMGSTPRYSGPFMTDTSLPEGWYRVTHTDYSGSGYDRGHMTPSADRTASVTDNQATFILTNILPQAPDNNQGLWAQFEDYTRSLVQGGNEVYIVAGGTGSLGTLANGRLNIPSAVWKVLLVLPAAEGDDVARISADALVIAIWTPNDASVSGTAWQDYQTTVRCVEQRTGLDFFTALDRALQNALEGAECPLGAPAPGSGDGSSSNGVPPATAPNFTSCAFDPGLGLAPETPVRVVTVDKVAETVTIENVTNRTINLDGWRMCSIRGGQEHPISGVIEPGATRELPSPPSNIWSNSERDPGALYDARGRLISYWPD